MHRWIILCAAVGVMLLALSRPSAAHAQDQGAWRAFCTRGFSLFVPPDWITQPRSGGQIARAATTRDAFEVERTGVLLPGEIVLLFSFNTDAELQNAFGTTTPAAILQTFVDDPQPGMTLGQVQPLDIGIHRAAVMSGTDRRLDGELFVVDVGMGAIMVTTATPAGEMPAARDLILQILATMRYVPDQAECETADVPIITPTPSITPAQMQFGFLQTPPTPTETTHPTDAPTATPVVIVITATPPPTLSPAPEQPTHTPGPSATPVVIVITATPPPTDAFQSSPTPTITPTPDPFAGWTPITAPSGFSLRVPPDWTVIESTDAANRFAIVYSQPGLTYGSVRVDNATAGIIAWEQTPDDVLTRLGISRTTVPSAVPDTLFAALQRAYASSADNLQADTINGRDTLSVIVNTPDQQYAYLLVRTGDTFVVMTWSAPSRISRLFSTYHQIIESIQTGDTP